MLCSDDDSTDRLSGASLVFESTVVLLGMFLEMVLYPRAEPTENCESSRMTDSVSLSLSGDVAAIVARDFRLSY